MKLLFESWRGYLKENLSDKPIVFTASGKGVFLPSDHPKHEEGKIPKGIIKIPNEEEKNLLKANGLQIKKGTVLTTYTGGGGGFEEPLERDPEDVLKDVKNRYVTIEKAKEDYKVSITANLEIDENATTKLRNN